MRIKMAKDSNNQYFGKLSDNLYGKFGAIENDEYLPIELTVEFPLEKYDDYSVSKRYSWNELVMLSKSVRSQLKSFGIENEQLQKCLWKFNTFYDKTNETTQIYTATNGAEFEEFKIASTIRKNMGMQRYITFDKNKSFVPIFDDFGEYNTEKDIEIFGSVSPYQSFVDTPIEYNYTLGDVTIYQTNVEFSCSVSFNVVLSKKQIKQLCVGDLAEYVKMEFKAPYYYGEGGTLECNFVPEYVAKCVDIDNLDDAVWTIPMSSDFKYYN
ncbi:MAG: hypothetical protein MJ193_02525, partial [Clostridia bacterium]|nr:hypothetical protein [Clostridia bacterium]